MLAAPAHRRPCIAGLGITEVGKVYGRTAADFAADAARRAVADAGLRLSDVDGLLVSSGLSGGVTLGLQQDLDLGNLSLAAELQAFGATAGVMVATAAMAVASGTANVVVCVHADAPLAPKVSAGASYSGADGGNLGQLAAPTGWFGLALASGVDGPNSLYALAARRHMVAYGTTSEQFGAIAVAQRGWAGLNPRAQFREPLTLAEHQASRWITEPLHLLDCCLVSNGGIAVVVTSADRAIALAQPVVEVLGWGQAHPGRSMRRNDDFGLVTGAARAGAAAYAMAGVGVSDIDIAELYDCYTYTVLVSLEDYGFCAKGEGGPFVESTALGPGGDLAVNTGGGQLSSYYLWGMTPLSEAVLQARGSAGDRQVDRHDTVLVSGNGGILDHHATLILGTPR